MRPISVSVGLTAESGLNLIAEREGGREREEGTALIFRRGKERRFIWPGKSDLDGVVRARTACLKNMQDKGTYKDWVKNI